MSNEMINESKKFEYQEATKYGTLRELKAVQMFMERGFIVSTPNMNVRYDFIAEKYPKYIRIQVKKLILKKGDIDDSLIHKTWCIRPYSTLYGKKRFYKEEDCDMVIGICLKTDTFAIVPIDKINEKTEFRLSEHETSIGREYLNSFKAINDFINFDKKNT